METRNTEKKFKDNVFFKFKISLFLFKKDGRQIITVRRGCQEDEMDDSCETIVKWLKIKRFLFNIQFFIF